MTQKDKKQKGKRIKPSGHRTGTIIELIDLNYKAKVLCWCGETLIIDSSKPITENKCPQCSSPYKLIDAEWTPEEMKKYMSIMESS